MITINPIDIKLLINKVERSISSNHICKEIINFPENASICYNIKIKHSKPLEGLDLNIGNINLYKTNEINTEYLIPIFTKDYPLLLTHINTSDIYIKLYGDVIPKDTIVEYSFDTILTKYQPIWEHIPVLHYIDGNFLFYKNKIVNLINISDLNKYKGTFTNNINLFKEEYIIHVVENDESTPKGFTDPRILEISTLSEWKLASIPSAYIFNVKGNINKDKFLDLAKELWNNKTYVFQQVKYEKEDEIYVNLKKLADMLNK